MKDYIKKNLEPLIIGYAIANSVHFVFQLISDIIIKIIIVTNP